MLSSAIDQSAVARVMGIAVIFQDLRGGNAALLPQVLGVVGQGNDAATYPLTKQQVTTSTQAGEIYGYGSPIHLAVEKLKPASGIGGVGTIPVYIHPLNKAVGATASAGDVVGVGVMTENAAYRVKVNNIESNQVIMLTGETFAARASDFADAVSAVLKMPVLAVDNAGTLELTAKASGDLGNDLFIEIEGPDAGVTFAVTQPGGGAGTSDVKDALATVGDTWETMLLNTLEISSSDTLDDYKFWGFDRWNPLVHKPVIVFTGYTGSKANITDVTDTRKDDFINSQLVAPSSNDLPYVVAAAELAEIASLANNNPAVDYGSLEVPSVNNGNDEDQMIYVERDAAVKGGSSTVLVRDGVMNLQDIVTMYHPSGEDIPPFRYVVDIVKEMQVVYNLALIFNGKPWDGAPLIPNDQPTTNPAARKPKDAVAELAALTDSLGSFAVLSAPAESKPLIRAEISALNPKRLDICYPHFLSGNANIISIDSKFSFYLG